MPGKTQSTPDRSESFPDSNEPFPDHTRSLPGSTQSMPDRGESFSDTGESFPDPTRSLPDTYSFLRAVVISRSVFLASPSTIIVFGLPNRSFSIPAKPGLKLRLRTITARACSTLKTGMP
ncbi:MAG: hypothetical protein QOH06_313 [Acidobacteriota bacterium]|nr:hypothetical protein [Acidobacteriota bacterium]